MNYGEEMLDRGITYLMREHGLSEMDAIAAEMDHIRRCAAAGDGEALNILRDIERAERLRGASMQDASDGFARSWNSDYSNADGSPVDGAERQWRDGRKQV